MWHHQNLPVTISVSARLHDVISHLSQTCPWAWIIWPGPFTSCNLLSRLGPACWFYFAWLTFWQLCQMCSKFVDLLIRFYCVLKVMTADRTEYLLHSSDSEMLHHWFQSLENNIKVSVGNSKYLLRHAFLFYKFLLYFLFIKWWYRHHVLCCCVAFLIFQVWNCEHAGVFLQSSFLLCNIQQFTYTEKDECWWSSIALIITNFYCN